MTWDQAEERANEVVKNLQLFFAFEMNRCNYDPKTFKIEDSQTFLHQRETPMTTNQFGPSGKNAIKTCRKAIGEPDMGYAELCFIESYSFNDGEQ